MKKRNTIAAKLKSIVETDEFRETLDMENMACVMLFIERDVDQQLPILFSTCGPADSLMVLGRGIERIANDWPKDMDTVLGQKIQVVDARDVQQILRQIFATVVADTTPDEFKSGLEEMKDENTRTNETTGGDRPGKGSDD